MIVLWFPPGKPAPCCVSTSGQEPPRVWTTRDKTPVSFWEQISERHWLILFHSVPPHEVCERHVQHTPRAKCNVDKRGFQFNLYHFFLFTWDFHGSEPLSFLAGMKCLYVSMWGVCFSSVLTCHYWTAKTSQINLSTPVSPSCSSF